MTTLAVLLRIHRTSRKLTQEQVAEAAGLSVRSVRNLESGAVRNPRSSSVHRIADALQLDGDAYRQLLDVIVPSHPDGGTRYVPAAGSSLVVALQPGTDLVVVITSMAAGPDDRVDTRLIRLSVSLPSD